jgi:hypothetical protein
MSAIPLLGIYPKAVKSVQQKIFAFSCSLQHYAQYPRNRIDLSENMVYINNEILFSFNTKEITDDSGGHYGK